MKTALLAASVTRTGGGLFDSLRGTAKALAQLADHQVTAIGLADQHAAQDLKQWSPIPVVLCSTFGPQSLGYSPGLRRALQSVNFDLIHSHGLWMYPSAAGLAWSKASQRPYLISPHGMLDPWALKNSRWKKVVAYWLYEQAHLTGASCLRALCESEASAMRQVGLKNPICIIPNGIDLPGDLTGLPALAPGNVQDAVHPLELLRAEGKKVLLYLGRLHPKKGLVNLIRAWAACSSPISHLPSSISHLQSPKSDWVLAIAGWDQGGHESELQQLATELGIRWQATGTAENGHDSSLVFLGPQFDDAKDACYRACDAFILPSLSEGLPMTVLEAWACEKPVLMTRECNLPEGFAADAAVRIEPTAASLREGLQTLFEMSDADRATMGRNGRCLVADRFTWAKIGDAMKDVYEWILGGGPLPPCVSAKR